MLYILMRKDNQNCISLKQPFRPGQYMELKNEQAPKIRMSFFSKTDTLVTTPEGSNIYNDGCKQSEAPGTKTSANLKSSCRAQLEKCHNSSNRINFLRLVKSIKSNLFR